MSKVVIVTGATSGYGLATAKQFHAQGAMVIAVSRDAEKVDSVVKEYGFADGFTADVTSYEAWVALRDFVKEKYGRVDVLVNNAGGAVALKPVFELTREQVDATIMLNLNSVIYGSQLFGTMMKEQKSGTIVNISSVCATHCWGNFSVYAAAKAAVVNFSKTLQVELQPYGARATCIIPASAATNFLKNAGSDGVVTETLTVDDVASAVLYAANLPAGAYVQDMTVWGTSQVMNPL